MMKKIMLMLMLCLLIGCSTANEDEEVFDFSLRYNVDGKDFISSFENTLKVDTIDGFITIDFELTEADMMKIKDKIIELELLEDNVKHFPKSPVSYSTIGIYDLKITMGEKDYRFYWTTHNVEPIVLDPNNPVKEPSFEGTYGPVNKLFNLKNFIVDIIMDYEEYKALPNHKMYL